MVELCAILLSKLPQKPLKILHFGRQSLKYGWTMRDFAFGALPELFRIEKSKFALWFQCTVYWTVFLQSIHHQMSFKIAMFECVSALCMYLAWVIKLMNYQLSKINFGMWWLCLCCEKNLNIETQLKKLKLEFFQGKIQKIELDKNQRKRVIQFFKCTKNYSPK